MHDNALAKALRRQGADCILQPVYTPIRTDEESIAGKEVFFGGVQVYLRTKFPWIRFVPQGMRKWLDHPTFLKLATRRSSSTDASSLGQLAISMLRGEHGGQAEEVNRLTEWLANEMQPDMVVLSNLLIGGSIPTIKHRLPDTKLVVLLQGDDIFLDYLPENERSEAIKLCSRLANDVDHFIVNSRFYGEKMASLLDIGDARWAVHPLSIDAAPFQRQATKTANNNRFRLGYLARIAPEKGLHNLVDAFITLADQPGHENVDLHVAGWLGDHNKPYLTELTQRIEQAGLTHRFDYHGSPDLDGKADFLGSLDLLSVPTDYEDPKGLFVLEAIAAGVPVVQPDHGAFGELLQSTGGGVVYPADSTDQLADQLSNLIRNPSARAQLVQTGQANLDAKHTIDLAAQRILDL